MKPEFDRVTDPVPPVSFRSAAAWVGLTAALALYAVHVSLYIRYVNDDAFITFRYSRFLAMGRGPYFNIGEHVEGYTNFLQMLLMAAVYRVGGEGAVPAAAKVLGILAGAAALAIVFGITVRLASLHPMLARRAPLAGFLAAAPVAVFPGFALNSTSGLETSLFSMLIALGAWLSLRGDLAREWNGAGLAWAAAAWTRPEGAVMFAVHGVASVVANALSRSRGTRVLPASLLIDAVLVAGALLAHLAFRLVVYDGEFLPNTYYAKASGFWGHTPW